MTISNISCSSDDNTETVTPVVVDQLIGKWDLKMRGSKITVDGKVTEFFENKPVVGNIIMQFEFNADKTVVYRVKGSPSGSMQTSKGTYVRSGDTVVITFENVQIPLTLKILNLEKIKLSLYNIQEFTTTEVKNGVEVEIKTKVESTYHLERMYY